MGQRESGERGKRKKGENGGRVVGESERGRGCSGERVTCTGPVNVLRERSFRIDYLLEWQVSRKPYQPDENSMSHQTIFRLKKFVPQNVFILDQTRRYSSSRFVCNTALEDSIESKQSNSWPEFNLAVLGPGRATSRIWSIRLCHTAGKQFSVAIWRLA
jgi:hypothetical protein